MTSIEIKSLHWFLGHFVMLITSRLLIWLRQIFSPLWINFFLSREVPFSIVLSISYLLLPVYLPEGQKDQVGQGERPTENPQDNNPENKS